MLTVMLIAFGYYFGGMWILTLSVALLNATSLTLLAEDFYREGKKRGRKRGKRKKSPKRNTDNELKFKA